MRITNIKWDIEEEDKFYTEYLPTEEMVNLNELTLSNVTLSELYCLVGDWLSDRWGYCHYDFEIRLEENEKLDWLY